VLGLRASTPRCDRPPDAVPDFEFVKTLQNAFPRRCGAILDAVHGSNILYLDVPELRDVSYQWWRLICEGPRLQCRSAYFSGVAVEGAKTLRQQGFSVPKLRGEWGSLDPVEPFARMMFHQDLATFSRSELQTTEQGVPVGDVVNGAVDLTIEAP
jgi:hypothetical protein